MSAAPILVDSRLKRPVTVQEGYVTVAELLSGIGDTTGVPLQCVDEGSSQRNMAVFASGKPAADLLDVLAQVLGLAWRAPSAGNHADGYELYQPSTSRLREDRLRREYRQQVLAALDKEVQAIEHDIETTKAGDALARDYALQDQARSLPDGAAKDAMFAAIRHLDAVHRFYYSPMLRFFLQLTGPAVDDLAAGRIVRFAAAPLPGPLHFYPLPSKTAREIVDGQSYGADGPWYPTHPPANVLAEMRIQVEGNDLMGKLNQVKRREARLLCRTEIIGPAPPGSNGMSGQMTVSIAISDKDVPRDPLKPTDVAHNVPDAGSVKLPPAVKRLNASDPATYIRGVLLADLIKAASNATPDVAFIADSYLAPIASAPAAAPSLRALIDQVCSRAGYSWQYDPRGFLALRDDTWFVDSPRSIPAPALRLLLDTETRQNGLGLRDLIQLSTRLTDDQIDGFPFLDTATPNVVLPPTPNAVFSTVYCQELENERDDLRFLASLGTGGLERLLSGGTIRYNGMTFSQQSALVRALDSPKHVADHIYLFPAGVIEATAVTISVAVDLRPQNADDLRPRPAVANRYSLYYDLADGRTAGLKQDLYIMYPGPDQPPAAEPAPSKTQPTGKSN